MFTVTQYMQLWIVKINLNASWTPREWEYSVIEARRKNWEFRGLFLEYCSMQLYICILTYNYTRQFIEILVFVGGISMESLVRRLLRCWNDTNIKYPSLLSWIQWYLPTKTVKDHLCREDIGGETIQTHGVLSVFPVASNTAAVS